MLTVQYTQTEHLTWSMLINKRKKSLKNEASYLYLSSLEQLGLPETYIPTCLEMNDLIQRHTNWCMVPTTLLVTASNYFSMLATCKFPVITTIRPIQEMDYYCSEKPDVMHEYFGHGPFLIHAEYSNFMQKLAKIALCYSLKKQLLLSRLFWFTIEFGLIQTSDGLRAYGAGIIPSQSEMHYALYDKRVERREFNLVDILRTPIRATQMQKIYYVIESFNSLFGLVNADLSHALLCANQRGNLDIE